MDPEAARHLRRLFDDRPVATLATLHRGEPATSMVPFVLPAGAAVLYIHISALAPHTRDLREHPRASLLVMDEPRPDVPPQALARVALQVDAEFVPRHGAEDDAGRAAYLARFPDAGLTFELGDFSLVALRPRSARRVAGFGQADSLVGERLEQWLRHDGA